VSSVVSRGGVRRSVGGKGHGTSSLSKSSASSYLLCQTYAPNVEFIKRIVNRGRETYMAPSIYGPYRTITHYGRVLQLWIKLWHYYGAMIFLWPCIWFIKILKTIT
jgi:hypothetical protein